MILYICRGDLPIHIFRKHQLYRVEHLMTDIVQDLDFFDRILDLVKHL